MLEWICHVRQTHLPLSICSGKVKKNTTLKKAVGYTFKKPFSASSKDSVVVVLGRTVGTASSEL